MFIGTLTLILLPFFVTAAAFAERLELQEALAKAAATSRILKIARSDEDSAVAGVIISRSGYLPRIDAQGGYVAQQAPQAIAMPQGTFETQQPRYAYFSLSLYQTLYDFGRTAARATMAKSALGVATQGHETRRQDLFLHTIERYFRILQLQSMKLAADQEVRQMAEHLRVAENFHEQGAVTRNDLLQAEVRLARSRQNSLAAGNQLENAWLVFNELIGEAPEQRYELVAGMADQFAVDMAAHTAVANRSELLAQQERVLQAQSRIDETRSKFYPEIFAKIGIDYVENSKLKEETIAAATVGIRFNIFEGQATTARYRQETQDYFRNRQLMDQLQADLALDYRMAVNTARTASHRISVVETAIRQGEENIRINKNRYQEQVGTATDVIDAQTLLTQIKNDYFQAIYDYEVSMARVKRARGDL